MPIGQSRGASSAPRKNNGPACEATIDKIHYPVNLNRAVDKEWMPIKENKTLCLVDAYVKVEGWDKPFFFPDLQVVEGKDGNGFNIWPNKKYDPNALRQDGTPGAFVNAYDFPYEVALSIKAPLTDEDNAEDFLCDELFAELAEHWYNYHLSDPTGDGRGAEVCALYDQLTGVEEAPPPPAPKSKIGGTKPATAPIPAGQRAAANEASRPAPTRGNPPVAPKNRKPANQEDDGVGGDGLNDPFEE